MQNISEGIGNKRTEFLRLLENSQNTSNTGIGSNFLGGGGDSNRRGNNPRN